MGDQKIGRLRGKMALNWEVPGAFMVLGLMQRT